MASLLSTKGGLLFVPGADGMLDALDTKTGEKLWSHNDGVGHDGGIITYVVNGKQYIAVTTGWGTWVSQNLAKSVRRAVHEHANGRWHPQRLRAAIEPLDGRPTVRQAVGQSICE